MKLILALLIITMLFISNSILAQNKKGTATVINITSDFGKVGFALYDKSNFRKKPIQGKESKIIAGKSIVIFEKVAAGEYAIICYHDKNNKYEFKNFN
jgi:uncharacterized protein (DUF2141 family)